MCKVVPPAGWRPQPWSGRPPGGDRPRAPEVVGWSRRCAARSAAATARARSRASSTRGSSRCSSSTSRLSRLVRRPPAARPAPPHPAAPSRRRSHARPRRRAATDKLSLERYRELAERRGQPRRPRAAAAPPRRRWRRRRLLWSQMVSNVPQNGANGAVPVGLDAGKVRAEAEVYQRRVQEAQATGGKAEKALSPRASSFKSRGNCRAHRPSCRDPPPRRGRPAPAARRAGAAPVCGRSVAPAGRRARPAARHGAVPTAGGKRQRRATTRRRRAAAQGGAGVTADDKQWLLRRHPTGSAARVCPGAARARQGSIPARRTQRPRGRRPRVRRSERAVHGAAERAAEGDGNAEAAPRDRRRARRRRRRRRRAARADADVDVEQRPVATAPASAPPPPSDGAPPPSAPPSPPPDDAAPAAAAAGRTAARAAAAAARWTRPSRTRCSRLPFRRNSIAPLRVNYASLDRPAPAAGPTNRNLSAAVDGVSAAIPPPVYNSVTAPRVPAGA